MDYSVPFLLKCKVYESSGWTMIDELGIVEFHETRRTKKTVARISSSNSDYYGDWDEICDFPKDHVWSHLGKGETIKSILEWADFYWGVFDVYSENDKFMKYYESIKDKVPGIIFPIRGDGEIYPYYDLFIFDERKITVEQVNLFLKPIKGSLRL
jgi:hypothetical protein